MNPSRIATLARRATEMFFRLLGRESTPTRPQAQVNIARMSPDSFEKWYRGYE